MYKKKYIIMLIPLLLFITSCSSDNNDNNDYQTRIEENTNINSSVDVPEAPKIQSAPTTSISVEENDIIKKFENSTQDIKDKWFYKELEDVGVTYSKIRKDYMRNKTCQLLRENSTIQYVIDNLTEFDLNEEQYAKLIGGSMITQCSELYATIKESDIDTIK